MFADTGIAKDLVADEVPRMDELNGNGKRGLPKLREILRRQKQDSEVRFLCILLVKFINSPISKRMRNLQILSFNMMMRTQWLPRSQRYLYETFD